MIDMSEIHRRRVHNAGREFGDIDSLKSCLLEHPRTLARAQTYQQRAVKIPYKQGRREHHAEVQSFEFAIRIVVRL